jgi:hypothetical protein
MASGGYEQLAAEVLTAYLLANVLCSCWLPTCLNTKRMSRTEPWIC